jgi:hypothetical protein
MKLNEFVELNVENSEESKIKSEEIFFIIKKSV